MSTVRVTGVHKSYRTGRRRIDALRGVDLEIDGPGFEAVMGPSGSGKSTLLHLLAALDRPDSGSIEVDGARLDAMSERDLTIFRRRRIGLVFQQFNLISTLTALDNVALPALLDGMARHERRSRAEALLASLGLAERAGHRPDALSGGEQQRVAIARALLFEPRVLLADEPTGNLDSEASERIWTLLAQLAAARSITVIMVTHEREAIAHCRRVHLVRDGRIHDTWEPGSLDGRKLANRA
jgi:putative ABC transport system ATP-binding protein